MSELLADYEGDLFDVGVSPYDAALGIELPWQAEHSFGVGL